MRIMGFKKREFGRLGKLICIWEDNIKKAGHCWKGQAVILIVQEDKHYKRLIQLK